MRDDIRAECQSTTQQLKGWQGWIACQSTVFELAKRIVVNNDYDNVIRMTRVLTAHYKNLIKKDFLQISKNSLEKWLQLKVEVITINI